MLPGCSTSPAVPEVRLLNTEHSYREVQCTDVPAPPESGSIQDLDDWHADVLLGYFDCKLKLHSVQKPKE